MSAIHRSSARLGLTAIACAALGACSSLDGATGRIANMVTPYKVEIVQGNFVSKEQVEALQRGMTRSQVKEVLGTPLMASVFHANRWDYVFTLKRQGVPPQQRKLALFFQGDQLDKWEGDEMPTEAEFVAQLDSGRRAVKVPLLEVPEEVLKEFNAKNPPSPKADVAAAAAAAPAAAYPPLEAPGTVTQAWDASTQRAVVAAAAARPTSPPPAAPLAAPSSASLAAPSSPSPAAPAAGTAAASAQAARPAPSPAPAASGSTVAPVVVGAAAVGTAAAAPARPAPAAVSPAPSPAAAPTSPAAAPAQVATAAAPAAPAAMAAPAPAPAPAVASGFAGMDADVAAFLNGWMNDWQARNAQAYFARYLPEFKGTSATRAEWEAQRRPRIETRSGMTLGVQDVRAVMVPPDGARIVFRQVYNSDAGSEVGTKALFLVKRDGRWLIEREFFTPAR